MKSRSPARTLIAVGFLVAVLIAGYRYGPSVGAALMSTLPSAPRGRSAVPNADEGVMQVVPGTEACGIALGQTPAEILASRGAPSGFSDMGYSEGWSWGDQPDGRYDAFTSLTDGKVRFVQCFLPSRYKSLVTGKSTRQDAVGLLGQPELITWWANGDEGVYRGVYKWVPLGLIVFFDPTTNVIVGFGVSEVKPD